MKGEEMTQSEIASKLGVSRQLVHGWFTGRSKPSREYVKKLNKITGISELQFLNPELLGNPWPTVERLRGNKNV